MALSMFDFWPLVKSLSLWLRPLILCVSNDGNHIFHFLEKIKISFDKPVLCKIILVDRKVQLIKNKSYIMLKMKLKVLRTLCLLNLNGNELFIIIDNVII